MATDITRGAAGSGYAAQSLDRLNFPDRVIDTAATNRVQNLVLECIHIKAGTFVLGVGVEIFTKEGGTLTLDVGDGTDEDGYLDGVDANTGTVPVWYFSNKGWTADVTNSDLELDAPTALNLFGILGGKLYTADDTIDVKIMDAADAAIFRVFAIVIDLTSRNRS